MKSKSPKISLEAAVEVFEDLFQDPSDRPTLKIKENVESYTLERDLREVTITYDPRKKEAVLEISAMLDYLHSINAIRDLCMIQYCKFFLLAKGYLDKSGGYGVYDHESSSVKDGKISFNYTIGIRYQRDLTRLCNDVNKMLQAVEGEVGVQ